MKRLRSNYLFILLALLSSILNANMYEDGLKQAAKGDMSMAMESFDNYFKNSINDPNQAGIIDKLIDTSTLFTSLSESILFIEKNIKFMKNHNSRMSLYRYLAEISELSGNIMDAGIYYEKAAYVDEEHINYKFLLDSISMLLELGYSNLSINKLLKIPPSLLTVTERDQLYILLSLSYKAEENYSKSLYYLDLVEQKSSRVLYIYQELSKQNNNSSFFLDSIEGDISADNRLKLRTPSDYIGRKSILIDVVPIPKKSSAGEKKLVGSYQTKDAAAGIINLLEQLDVEWFFDLGNGSFDLYIYDQKLEKVEQELLKIGIVLGE